MRIMNLAELPRGPNSVEECASRYAARLSADEMYQPRSSLVLTAYMAWPNDEPRRDSFVATYLSLLLQKDGSLDLIPRVPSLKTTPSSSGSGV